MMELWPFTNFHDLNLDWIVKKIRNVEDSEAAAKASEEAAAASARESAASASEAEESSTTSESLAEAAQTYANTARNYSENMSTLEGQVQTNTNRIDNLVANAGDTDNNAELLDIRTSFTGRTYPTAGSEVRGSDQTLFDMIRSTQETEAPMLINEIRDLTFTLRGSAPINIPAGTKTIVYGPITTNATAGTQNLLQGLNNGNVVETSLLNRSGGTITWSGGALDSVRLYASDTYNNSEGKTATIEYLKFYMTTPLSTFTINIDELKRSIRTGENYFTENDFEYGSLVNGILVDHTKRIRSKNFYKSSTPVILTVNNGTADFGVLLFDDNLIYANKDSGWRKTVFVPENTFFRIVVKDDAQDGTLDIATTIQSLTASPITENVPYKAIGAAPLGNSNFYKINTAYTPTTGNWAQQGMACYNNFLFTACSDWGDNPPVNKIMISNMHTGVNWAEVSAAIGHGNELSFSDIFIDNDSFPLLYSMTSDTTVNRLRVSTVSATTHDTITLDTTGCGYHLGMAVDPASNDLYVTGYDTTSIYNYGGMILTKFRYNRLDDTYTKEWTKETGYNLGVMQDKKVHNGRLYILSSTSDQSLADTKVYVIDLIDGHIITKMDKWPDEILLPEVEGLEFYQLGECDSMILHPMNGALYVVTAI